MRLRYDQSFPGENLAIQILSGERFTGALGTVMNNLAALGAGLLAPVTAIGDDGHGYDLLREVRKLPVDPTNILCLPERLTPTYTKPLRQDASGKWRELNRLDVRTRGPLSAAATAEVCRRVEEVFRTSDGLIVRVREACACGDGAWRARASSSSRTPKFFRALPKKTGVRCPARYVSRSRSG